MNFHQIIPAILYQIILRDNYNFADFHIILVEKGPCSFPKMARKVEKKDGDMILIVNNETISLKKYQVTGK